MELKINPCVCFFDSGIGGLSLLYECVRRLPNVDFIYFADNHNVPYGNLTGTELTEIADRHFNEMQKYNPDVCVLACNTLTSECVDFLRKKYKFKIVGIQPEIKTGAMKGECLVLATAATAQSASVKELCLRYGQNRTRIQACPDLAFYIEKNIERLDADTILKMLPSKGGAKSVVLGCTHYVFIKDLIQQYYNCPVYDGISGTASHLCDVLNMGNDRVVRTQTVRFCGGDEEKNSKIFRAIVRKTGFEHSQLKKNP